MTTTIRRASTLMAGAATAVALAVPAAAAEHPDPGPGVAKDRIEHTVTEVRVSGTRAAKSFTRIEQWLSADRLRTVTRDARTGKLVSEVVTDARGTRIYDGGSGKLTRSEETDVPQLSRDQEARITRQQVAAGSLRVAEDRGDVLVLRSVPGKWTSDVPGAEATVLVNEVTFRTLERTSAMPEGQFTQHVRSIKDETLARTQGNAKVFTMSRQAAHESKPKGLFLGRTSGGAAAEWVLGATPRSQSVRIAGREARVKLIESDGRRVYRAFVNRAGLQVGRSYTVTIKVTPRSGRSILRTERLVLHRSMNR